MLAKKILNLRFISLFGILVGLCLSEGVGLQLLPFSIKMSAHNLSPVETLAADFASCSASPPRSEFIPHRTEIVAPKLKRLSPDRPGVETEAASLDASRELQSRLLDAALYNHTPSGYSLHLACRKASRAPPGAAQV